MSKVDNLSTIIQFPGHYFWDRLLFFGVTIVIILPVGLANVLSEGSLHYSSCLLEFAAGGNS